MQYYVYAYLDPRKEQYTLTNGEKIEHEPFYVGKGKGKRAWCHLDPNNKSNNRLKKDKIARIVQSGYVPKVVMLAEGLDEETALALEEDWITRIGTKWCIKGLKRGPLCNMTSGGDGRTPCEETRKRYGSPGESNPMFGKTHTPEAKAKIREQSKKLRHSEETKRKMRVARSNGNNYNAKHWELQCPDGSIIVVRDLAGFIKEHGFSYQSLHGSYQRKKPITRGLASGYRLLGPVPLISG